MILRADGLVKRFDTLSNNPISFESRPFTFTILKGGSGAGKTTLLNMITGMLHPDAGNVLIDCDGEEKDIYKDLKKQKRTKILGKRIGYMMQSVSLIHSLTVYENVKYTLKLAGCEIDDGFLNAVFEKLGIEKIMNSYPNRISGGEYRRVLFAETLLKKPELIVADEPTAFLDDETAEIVRNALYDFVGENTSVIVATHDNLFEKADIVIDMNE